VYCFLRRVPLLMPNISSYSDKICALVLPKSRKSRIKARERTLSFAHARLFTEDNALANNRKYAWLNVQSASRWSRYQSVLIRALARSGMFFCSWKQCRCFVEHDLLFIAFFENSFVEAIRQFLFFVEA